MISTTLITHDDGFPGAAMDGVVTSGCQRSAYARGAHLLEEVTRLARTRERARIAREIHDTLAQDLTAIQLHLEGALRSLEVSPERSRERLLRALATTHESLIETRRSVVELRASPLAERSLWQAINALARAFTAETGVPVRIQARHSAELPPRIEADLYWIIQEALVYVRKHAHATRVKIELHTSKTDVELSVRDDGVGFGTEPVNDGGYGLLGIQERVELLAGDVSLDSRPGQGTVVSLRVPLGREAAEGQPLEVEGI